MAVAQTTSENQGTETVAVHSPINGELIGHIPVTSEEEVAAAVERARAAQPAWEALGFKGRRKILLRWLDLLKADEETLIHNIRRETGKVEAHARLEQYGIQALVLWLYHNAHKVLKRERRTPAFPIVQRVYVSYKPHGVVGFITPWNYPFLLAFIDLLPALIAGNAVVLKPSEVTPFIAQYGMDKLHEAGVPKDVAQIVHGDGRTGAALVNYVDYISFTGSTEVGRKVAIRAAERLIPYTMELGGKDPSIVLRDANLDMTATGLLRGAFENSGQACVSVERVYVEAPIYEQLLERIVHYANQMKVGKEDGMELHMGCFTNENELQRTERHIEDAVAKGARVLVGGKRRPDLGPLFFEPTVIVDVDHTMDIMKEETFGPVIPIMKVKDAEEAIKLANDNEYGLSASIFTRNLKRGQELALKLNCGDVGINRTHLGIGTPSIPSGGQKLSGIGRRGGPEGLKRFVVTQSHIVDTLWGQKPDLRIADPMSVRMIELLVRLRRYIPFL